MKVSVSLPQEDIEFLDAYARTEGIASRSAALHRAVRLLRSGAMGEAYADAWREWDDAGESTVWEAALGDGLG